jgi:hypothetical protein
MGYANVGAVRWRKRKLRGMMPVMRWRLATCLALAFLCGCNLPAGSGPGLEPPGQDTTNFGNPSEGDPGPTGSINDPNTQPPAVLNPSDMDQLDEPLSGEGGGRANAAGAGAMSPADGVAGTANTGGMAPDPEPTPPPNGAAAGTSASPPPTAPDAGSSSADAGTPQGSVSCDPQQVFCDVEPEPCDGTFRVREVVDGCYGGCVAIEACACDGPAACPDANQYTCLNSSGHCSPYLN